ncbi:GNAT family N-acetyltransferase [Streptomyces sp. NBC_00038]|uniref:GNAT family N-acetyltransferase n=1 Tax=Streptomyces sp. NBC_00038 TaxID=2903615 RepID=UPI00225A140F|nr:GNAT family N-acetyltransferase [Streptomyces sp. NBC_00038]MCX5558821.1 GNAT family N-acetyltransferase [Streptomyces sp. NBC_00038]
MNHVIRSIRSDEWAQVRELRLAALRDPVAHLAFLETYEDAAARPDEFWQERAAGACEGTAERRQFVAVGQGGVWDGSVAVLVEEAGERDFFGGVVERRQGHLVGVYVRPERRGSAVGVTRGLFDAALEWSWGVGLERVRLFVHEKNGRAEAFYRKAGFLPSGVTVPSSGGSGDTGDLGDSGERELEFVVDRPVEGKGPS